jgi:16S rRNA (guanine1207-N2)-methyltransferase
VAATIENIGRNSVDNASAMPSDALSAVRGRRYELVATNPPFHAGRAIDYHVARTFIEQAHDVIVPGGTFLLVANRFIPYDQGIHTTYGNVRTIAETNRYRLFAATRTAD